MPAHYQGRAFGARRLVAQGVIPLGLVLGSTIAARAGTYGVPLAVIFVFCGIMEVAGAGALGVASCRRDVREAMARWTDAFLIAVPIRSSRPHRPRSRPLVD